MATRTEFSEGTRGWSKHVRSGLLHAISLAAMALTVASSRIVTKRCELQAELDRAIAEYAGHCHSERRHRGIGNEIVSGAAPQSEGNVEVKERLGGLLKYYHRRAA